MKEKNVYYLRFINEWFKAIIQRGNQGLSIMF